MVVWAEAANPMININIVQIPETSLKKCEGLPDWSP
jgi:hypothetical protein